MSEIINGTSNTGAIEEEYGVIIDGSSGLINVDGSVVFDSTVFHPLVWYMRKLVNFPPLPVSTPVINYTQDTNGDGYIDFDSVAKYDSTGTAYVILDIEYDIPQLLGTNKYYLASNNLIQDIDITSKDYTAIGTQYNVPLDGTLNTLAVTTHAMIYNVGINPSESDTTSKTVQLVPKSYPYNYLVAKPLLVTDFTTICSTTVYANCTASIDGNSIAYSASSDIPSTRNLTVDWVLVSAASGTYITVSPSNSFSIQITLDQNDQRDTLLRCYFNKGTQFESYSDSTIKRTPADTAIPALAMTINKIRTNDVYFWGSKAGYIPEVLVTQMQQQLAYFDSNHKVLTPRYPSTSDQYIITWQNPQDSSTYTCFSRTLYTINSDRSLTKIADLGIDDESYTISTDKNLAIGCTFNYTDINLRKRFKNRTQIQTFLSSDVDKNFFTVTDSVIVPLGAATVNSVIQTNVSIIRNSISINMYIDTPQVSVLANSYTTYTTAPVISRSSGSTYSVIESTPQVSTLGFVLNKVYQSTTTISRSKGISIGS